MAQQDLVAPVTPTILQTWRAGNLASVAASAVNSFKIETGNNVHGIQLKFAAAGGVTPLTRAQLITDVASVRMWLNGELIFDRTATQILDLYKYEWDKYTALAAPLGVLVISCMNKRVPIWDQARGFALGMMKTGGTPGQGPYNTLTMEVTMTAGVATAVVGEVHVVSDLYPQEATGLHVRRLRTTRDILAVGANLINDLPRTAFGLLSVHIASALMTRLTVSYNDSMLYKDLDVDGLSLLLDQAGLTPQGYAHIPFDLGEDVHSYLPFTGMNKFELQPTFSGAPGAGTVVLTEEVWTSVRE